jgi:putative alpha-1,2-mannosidase
MPVTGRVQINESERASWFSHKAEVVKPYYYSVYLSDYDVTVEITPTERAAILRFTFPENDSSFILLDGFNEGSMVKIVPSERTVIGYCRNNSGGVPANFHNYFVALFDRDFASASTWHGDTIDLNDLESEGDHAGAVLDSKPGKEINNSESCIFT